MKLRNRSQSEGGGTVKKKKKKGLPPVRRSERIKNDEKVVNESDPSKVQQKKDMDKNQQKKKKLKSKVRKRGGSSDDGESSSDSGEVIITPILQTGIKDILSQTEEEGSAALTSEADVIVECRSCFSMFRHFGTFIKHKQLYCPSLAEKKSPETWNPFFNKEIFDFFLDEELSMSSSSSKSDLPDEGDSAYEDGLSSN